MTATERLLDALRQNGSTVRASGGRKHMATCPAHEDGTPSLSVTEGESRVLLRCHANCDIDDVLAALNLTRADLFDEPITAGRTKPVVAAYDYVDEDGTLLFQVVRLTPKGFRQRRPDGSGWQWNLNGVRSVIYQLPSVLAAVKTGQQIYITEGEKDADLLASAGVAATCNPGGAGKWRTKYGDVLIGAEVVVVADRDEPGYAHARQVAADLAGRANTVRVVEPVEGKDVSDHLAAGHTLDALVPVNEGVDGDSAPGAVAGLGAVNDGVNGPSPPEARRHLTLTPASDITPQRVKWVWSHRMAAGTLALLGGREGSGKSTLAYYMAALLTRGALPGEYHGVPRAVLVCATEDSWAHTIVPKLIAANADLDLVYQVEVVSADDVHVGLNLPRDIHRVEEATIETGAAMLLLDPLMSRIDPKLDTHKDGELRQSLEPIAALANRTGLLVLGLIHFNKTGTTDVLDRIMGSKAFVAVARSVSVVVADPDDETGARRLFGTPKNNMGRTDLPSLGFTIESYELETDDGPTSVGKVVFGDETDVTISEAMERVGEAPDVRTATGEAKEWLHDYLTEHGGSAESAEVKSAAGKAGHAERTLQKARKALKVLSESIPGVMPRRTTWTLPAESASCAPDSTASCAPDPWGDYITDTTYINAGQSVMAPNGDTTSRVCHGSGAVPPREGHLLHEPSTCPSCLLDVSGPPGNRCDSPDVHPTGVLL